MAYHREHPIFNIIFIMRNWENFALEANFPLFSLPEPAIFAIKWTPSQDKSEPNLRGCRIARSGTALSRFDLV
jgi:hypothetical protein